MWVLFKYMCMISGLSGFLLISSSCGKSHNQPGSGSNIWPFVNDANVNAMFKVERRVKSNLSSFYSIEDRIMFVSRQNRNQPYDQIQSIQVDGECHGEFGNSIQINKAIPSNVFSFYTVLSLKQLQPHLNTVNSNLRHSIKRSGYTNQAYQCNFSFAGITINGSTKSVQNVRVEIPKRPRGGIAIHHRSDQNRNRRNDKIEFTESDFKDYHVTLLNSSPDAYVTLKCSDFQETVSFNSKTNSKKNLASIFNLQKYYSLLMINPLQHCYITYGNFGDPHWAWSRSFKFFFEEAFKGVFDLRFDLKRIVDPRVLRVDQTESTENSWIQLGVLRVVNPFSEPMLITLNKNHNSYLKSHIYYLRDELGYRFDSKGILKKESHDIFLQFARSDTERHRTGRGNNILNVFGGPNYAFHIEPRSSVTRQVVIKTLEEVDYSTYGILGFEIIKSENQNQQDFLKLYFHNSRGRSTIPVFDEFKDEALVSVCAFRFCQRAFEIMLYNSQIRTGQIF